MTIADDAQRVIDEATAVEQLALLTVKEYADLHRVHVQTVYTAIRFGRLDERVKRVGRTIRIVVARGTIQGLTTP